MPDEQEDRSMGQMWVLWWRYSDGSGQGLERAYCNEDRAKQDLELAAGDSIKEWKLDAVNIYGPVD